MSQNAKTVSTGRSDAARAARNAYAREWRKKNPDKVKAANVRYWEKKAAKQREAEGYADDEDNS